MGFDILSYAIGMQAGKNSGGGGGGSVEGVHYVTFMSEDGTTELYKRVVADGDDCADPVDRGLIPEPTKESTAQYSYTHVGWSASPNGALDENILKAVKADKTVYANFAAVLRYYTITYYDSDGKTVLKTESVAYGTKPASYTPTKEGVSFAGWDKDVVTVIGDASYIAQWQEAITFAKGSWADIIRIAEEGKAQEYFALKDERTFTFTDPNGTTQETILRIVGFGVDDLADGSGKAAISLMTVKRTYMGAHGTDTSDGRDTWQDSLIRETLNGTVFNSFPTELKNGIKSVKKLSRKYVAAGDKTGILETYDKVWLPSAREFDCSSSDSKIAVETEAHNYVAGGIVGSIFRENSSESYSLNTRSNSVDFKHKYVKYVSRPNGYEWSYDYGVAPTVYVVFGFCI